MDGEWREILTEWKGEGAFIARNAAGGTVQMGTLDGVPGVGPMQLLLVALAGCTGVDVASIMEKKRQPLDDLKIRVRGKMADTYPKVYTELEIEFYLWGSGLDPKAIEQAIELSEEKYCSVGAMLRMAAPIKTTYRILAPGEALEEKEEMKS